MNLTASDFYSYLRPGRCARRVYLRHIGAAEEPASPYDQVLERLGQRHEASHLSSFPEFTDLSKGRREERREQTVAEVQRGAKVLYQPVLEATEKLSGVDCRILGEPDFLIRNNGGYLVRDSKMSRRINQKDHPEILGQLTTYGWLYERTFGAPAVRLEVHSGTGEIVPVPYEPDSALQTLATIAEIKGMNSEPYGAVGWSKCDDCGFRSHCWQIAEQNRTVDLIYGVDQSLATALHGDGVDTIDDLLERFDAESLAEYKRPWGTRMQRVGKQANQILVMVEALRSGQHIVLQRLAVPDRPNYVMFDLEGLPPQLDELD